MKKTVNAFDYAETICKAMKNGILLTTKLGEKVNTMTIGWGMVGVEWGKPVFIALVRESRYTKKFLDATGEFTVNIPVLDVDSKILSICGSKSGRDLDKIQVLDLDLEESEVVSVPGIRQLPLTLECKVLYKQNQDPSEIPATVINRYYPEVGETLPSGEKRDYHTAYYAEIVNAYLISE